MARPTGLKRGVDLLLEAGSKIYVYIYTLFILIHIDRNIYVNVRVCVCQKVNALRENDVHALPWRIFSSDRCETLHNPPHCIDALS